MRRRQFIKGVGVSSAALATTRISGVGVQNTGSKLPEYSYGGIGSLNDVISQEGLVVIRIAVEDNLEVDGHQLAGRVNVKKAEIKRARSYFFENDEEFNGDPLSFETGTMGSDKEVILLWLKDANEKTLVRITGGSGFQFTLDELIEKRELSAPLEGITIKANFLLDREIGEITPGDFGAREPGDDFSFVAMADPQGGLPDDTEKLKTRMKIHNAFIEESVNLANRLDFDPLFTVIAGDVCDDWGYEKDLVQMNAFLSKLKSPVLYGIGNHETLLKSEFGPGYNMDAFGNFLAAQKSINGLEKLLYSFNAGQWHFVVWPDPLRKNFWETHPHYFNWLERDLKKNKDRPTMVFQHVPIQPIGITPHINYAESVFVRSTFLDILTKHGNVKYCLSGHVHIPVKASFKTAVSMRGINLINLPAAGYRPRSFGEEDYYGGPSQGCAIIQIRGDQATIQYKTVTEEIFEYPAQLPEFDEVAYPLWLNQKWELPAVSNFNNGNFQNGLTGWAKRFVYTEDAHPSNLREVRSLPGKDGSGLYLYCRRRGYQAPGQDRLPQDINRLSQAVEIEKGVIPVIRLNYRIDGGKTDPKGYSGGYILVEGYSGSNRVHNLMYSAGKIWVNTWGARNLNKEVPYHHFGLTAEPDSWHSALLNITTDFEKSSPGKNYPDLKVDRLVVTLGVWNINDGDEQPFGIYFTNFVLESAGFELSNIGGVPIEAKPEEDVWWMNKTWPWVNASGEHRYIINTQNS
ncbi:MAG: metallophosphoesterase [Bacteroidales bacterium]|nr:metallophosphoesterase [Bacteroidales bacterium]